MDAGRMRALADPGGALHRACRDGLGVDGVSAVGMQASPGAARGPELAVCFQGWSPSLHRVAVHVAGRVAPEDAELSDEEIAGRLLDIYRPAFERQRRRAADAFALGPAKPDGGGRGGPRQPIGNGRVHHLMIDEAMAPIARASGVDLAGAVRDAVGNLHAMGMTHGGGVLHMARRSISVREVTRGDRTLRYVAPRIRIRTRSSRRAAVHMGHHVRVEGAHLPEAVLASLVGRPAGDLARLHPAIDGRIIRRVTNDGTADRPAILVGIDQHLQPLDDALAAA